ncbi:flagellar filament capping protein FliD [Lachnospiraceae bacterium 46-15]
MGISGVSGSSAYDYQSTLINSSSTYKTASYQAKETVKNLSSGSSTNKTTSSASSTTTFLMGYRSTLEDMEAVSSKLQVGSADSVFSRYEAVRADAEDALQAGDDAAYQKATAAMDKEKSNIISSVKDFVKQYNETKSYLSSNSSRSSAVASHLSAFERAVPSEKTLKAMGLSIDKYGKMQLDEEKLTEALDKDYEETKNLLGGQYGLAERVGAKATAILDTPVDKIAGVSGSSSTGTGNASSSAAASSNKTTMSESFLDFARFARSGAYNLGNYYAVGTMLNLLV